MFLILCKSTFDVSRIFNCDVAWQFNGPMFSLVLRWVGFIQVRHFIYILRIKLIVPKSLVQFDVWTSSQLLVSTSGGLSINTLFPPHVRHDDLQVIKTSQTQTSTPDTLNLLGRTRRKLNLRGEKNILIRSLNTLLQDHLLTTTACFNTTGSHQYCSPEQGLSSSTRTV